MKKINLNLIFPALLFILLGMWSCSKDVILNDSIFPQNSNFLEHNTSTTNQHSPTDPPCQDVVVCSSPTCLLKDVMDPSNDQVNMIMYHYASATNTLAKLPTTRCSMIETMAGDLGDYAQTISLREFVENEGVELAFQEALRTSILTNDVYPLSTDPAVAALATDPTWNADEYLMSNLTYAGIEYQPMLYFVDTPSPSASCNVKPNILIAEGINTCDEVVGWDIDDDMILIGEDGIKGSFDFNIFVGIGGKGDFEVGDRDDDGSENPSNGANWKIELTEFTIKNPFFFERRGDLEVFSGVRIYNPKESNGLVGDRINSFLFRKVFRDNVVNSTTIEGGEYFEIGTFEQGPDFKFFITAVEYDWYSFNRKVVDNPCDEDFTLTFKARFESNFYFQSCGNVSTFSNLGDELLVENEKCTFLFTRVE